MELSQMTMVGGRAAAREAFLEYRHAVHASYAREHEAIDERRADIIRKQREADEALMAGYRQIALGRQVISVHDTIRAGGLDKGGRPKIAVAHGHLTRVRVDLTREGRVTFDDPARHGYAKSASRIRFPDETFDRNVNRGFGGITATAIVPSIPPRLRPLHPERYWLLFEAEYVTPPVDPALLRPLGDGLAVVVATWDLTPLERAVLGMTR